MLLPSDKLYLNALTIHLLQEKCVTDKLLAVFMFFLKIDPIISWGVFETIIKVVFCLKIYYYNIFYF
jgi:hypothetical protein